jgi:hypothetical protein
MISYKASVSCNDLRIYTEPKQVMARSYLTSEQGFTDGEMRDCLRKKGFKITISGVGLLRNELNNGVNQIINVNNEKRQDCAVWRWRE